MDEIYDICIVGGGPAGMTAGIYAARARMKTLLFEQMACGGQMLLADTLENFPGFPKEVKGPELAEWMCAQAQRFGLAINNIAVSKISKTKDGSFILYTSEGKEVRTLSVILATGARWNMLGIPGEKELIGRGVSYCATCDGPLFKGKEVVVVGGGDTALGDALFLTKFASKVTIVHRRDRFRGTKILQERISANPKIELCMSSIAVEILGKNKCEAVKVKNTVNSDEKTIKTDGIFIFIGLTPNSDPVKGLVRMDEKGYVICDDRMHSSLEGVFACGDVRQKAFRQVVTAAGDGATAAFSAQHYVDMLKGNEYK